VSPLRQRVIQGMQLRGFSARTQECYVAAVRQLSKHYRTSPDQLREEDLRHYFLYLANEKKAAHATATIALCGIKFFYEQTLQRPWSTLRLIRPPRQKKLPVVLSRQEVRRAPGAVRIPDAAAHPRQGQKRPLRASARADPPDAPRFLAHASLPGVVVPRAYPSRSGAQPRPQRRPGHPQQSPPPTCWRPASTCASSKTTWSAAARVPPRSAPI